MMDFVSIQNLIDEWISKCSNKNKYLFMKSVESMYGEGYPPYDPSNLYAITNYDPRVVAYIMKLAPYLFNSVYTIDGDNEGIDADFKHVMERMMDRGISNDYRQYKIIPDDNSYYVSRESVNLAFFLLGYRFLWVRDRVWNGKARERYVFFIKPVIEFNLMYEFSRQDIFKIQSEFGIGVKHRITVDPNMHTTPYTKLAAAFQQFCKGLQEDRPYPISFVRDFFEDLDFPWGVQKDMQYEYLQSRNAAGNCLNNLMELWDEFESQVLDQYLDQNGIDDNFDDDMPVELMLEYIN